MWGCFWDRSNALSIHHHTQRLYAWLTPTYTQFVIIVISLGDTFERDCYHQHEEALGYQRHPSLIQTDCDSKMIVGSSR